MAAPHPSPLAPSPLLYPSGGLTTTCRIPARVRWCPLPRHLKPHSLDLGLKIGGYLGLGFWLRGSRGDKNLPAVPPPPEESQLGREDFSSHTPASRGPRLASRVPQRRRAFSLARGEARRNTPNQSGRGEEGAEPSLRGLRSSAPLPKVWGRWRPEPALHRICVLWWQRESAAGDFRTESARSSDPGRLS